MKKIKYLLYVAKYYIQHERGMTPACYNEWLDNEYLEKEV